MTPDPVTGADVLTPLWTLAHARARAGDKGDSSILVLRPYRAEDFRWLAKAVTVAVVARHFAARPEDVTIRTVPELGTMTLVLRNQLAGGVTRSLRVDPHGKTLSGHLLDRNVSTSAIPEYTG